MKDARNALDFVRDLKYISFHNNLLKTQGIREIMKLASLIFVPLFLASCSILNKSYVYPLGEKREFKKEISMPEFKEQDEIQRSLIFTKNGNFYMELSFGKNGLSNFIASYRICDGGKSEKFPIIVYDLRKNIMYVDNRNPDGIADRVINNLGNPDGIFREVYLETRKCLL